MNVEFDNKPLPKKRSRGKIRYPLEKLAVGETCFIPDSGGMTQTPVKFHSIVRQRTASGSLPPEFHIVTRRDVVDRRPGLRILRDS